MAILVGGILVMLWLAIVFSSPRHTRRAGRPVNVGYPSIHGEASDGSTGADFDAGDIGGDIGGDCGGDIGGGDCGGDGGGGD